jgi:hypothetical protein
MGQIVVRRRLGLEKDLSATPEVDEADPVIREGLRFQASRDSGEEQVDQVGEDPVPQGLEEAPSPVPELQFYGTD